MGSSCGQRPSDEGTFIYRKVTSAKWAGPSSLAPGRFAQVFPSECFIFTDLVLASKEWMEGHLDQDTLRFVFRDRRRPIGEQTP
jgi:hypothetical protein